MISVGLKRSDSYTAGYVRSQESLYRWLELAVNTIIPVVKAVLEMKMSL